MYKYQIEENPNDVKLRDDKNDLMKKIDDILKKKFKDYSCKEVSWDDVSRNINTLGTKKFLSCYGNNITDSYLVSKNGVKLYTIRPDNWNEKIGIVDASNMSVIDNDVKVNLDNYLKNILPNKLKELNKELNISDLYIPELDNKVSVRFQTTFLPISNNLEDLNDFEDLSVPSIEFCAETYNYNTTSDDNPRNILLLATSDGTFISFDKTGKKKLFRYSPDMKEQWFLAEETKFNVGSKQEETEEEQAFFKSLNKAIAKEFGLEGMGKLMNCIATIQIPLEIKTRPINNINNINYNLGPTMLYVGASSMPGGTRSSNSYSIPKSINQSSIARVSAGSNTGKTHTVSSKIKNVKRDSSQHITITFIFYYVINGTNPSEEDINTAVEQLESFTKLYSLTNYQSSFMLNKTDSNISQVPITQIPIHVPLQVPLPLPLPVPSIPSIPSVPIIPEPSPIFDQEPDIFYVRYCPYRHRLQVYNTELYQYNSEYSRLTCDMCNRRLRLNENVYSCRLCDYDVCVRCIKRSLVL